MRFGGDNDSHYNGQENEFNDPHYCVSFWEGTSEEWIEIYEADADEVLHWVEENAGDRSYTIYARITDEVALRLVGVDPTAFDEDFPPWARRGGPPAVHPPSAVRTAEAFRQPR